MEEEKKNKNFKTGLNDKEKQFQKHLKLKNSGSKREERLALKRTTKNEDRLKTTDINKLIGTFPLEAFLKMDEPMDIVDTLLNILKTENIESYYAPSETNTQGPYLFKDDIIIKKLVSFLHSSKNIPFLIKVSHCCICISAHPQCMIWSTKLLHYNFLIYAIQLLEHCGHVTVKENLIWTLANLVQDNKLCRDFILKHGGTHLIDIICKSLKNTNDENIISICVIFTSSLFKDIPVPPLSLIKPLFDVVIDLFVSIQEIQDNHLYTFILESIRKISKLSDTDDYRLYFCNHAKLMSYIMNHMDLPNADIIKNLTYTEEAHSMLLSNNVLKYFLFLLDNRDPKFRIIGSTGFRVLASNQYALDLIMKKETLDIIQKHLEYSQIYEIQTQLKLILSQIVLTIGKIGMVKTHFPILLERGIHKVIVNALSEQHDMMLLLNIVVAIKYLIQYDKRLMKETIEDYGFLDRLESLSMNCKDKHVSSTAEFIINYLDSDMDLDED
jgi:hypothetical protein